MRNLKKFLALVLAMMMVLSLMVTVNAASSTYSDADKIGATYKTAVNVLTAVGVFQGDEGGFRPTDYIKRSEFAKVIYMIKSGDTSAKNASLGLYADACDFRDIAGSGEEWAKPFIGYASTYGLVKGSGPKGDFYPKDYISVVDVLTILLRALGYGQGNELTGTMYQVNALRLAEDAGLLANIPDGITTKNAERQVVAQLIYNVIQASTVTGYNTTTGKYTVDGASLAVSTLGMVKTPTSSDGWGNPINGGWTYGGQAITSETVVDVGTFYNVVSECDIWDVLEKDGPIVAYYVDGIKQNITDNTKANYTHVFTSGASYHDTKLEDHPSYTTGANGVTTVVYWVDNGYWIVQYNVWLAQVTKVNEATTDDNGHPIGRTYDVRIFVDYKKDGVDADARNITLAAKGCLPENAEDEFKKDDYVLVHVNNPVYASGALSSNAFVTIAGDAPVLATGKISEIYNKVITVGDGKYTESLKYYLNKEEDTDDVTWTLFSDDMGDGKVNVIGQVQGALTYAVVEKIEWKHSPDKIGEGYALADIRLDDGTLKKDVRIPGIYNLVDAYRATVNTTDNGTGDPDTGKVSDDFTSNGSWYHHVYQYTETDEGYILRHAGVGVTWNDAVINKGNARITVNNGKNSYTVDDDTIFFVRTGTYAYEVYKGIDNLGYSRLSGEICVAANDETGYAKAVVAWKPSAPATYPVYFIKAGTAITRTGSGVNEKYYTEMYPIGSARTERVQLSYKDVLTGTGTAENPYVMPAVTATGLYQIQKNANGIVTAINPVTNGNFYGVTDGGTNPSKGQMPTTGVNDLATRRYAGTFYLGKVYNINSVNTVWTDDPTEYPFGGTTINDIYKIGIKDGAAGRIKPDMDEKNKNGYTVNDADKLEDYYDFRLNDATVVKVNLEAGKVTKALTGNFTLEAGTKSDITSDSLALFVYDWDASSNEMNVVYAYVYKVVFVDQTVTPKTLHVFTDNIVGCEWLDKDREGAVTLDSDGNGEFIVTAPTAETKDGIRVIYNKVPAVNNTGVPGIRNVEIYNLKDEAGVSTWRIKVTGANDGAKITVVANTVTSKAAKGSGKVTLQNPDAAVQALYTTLGITLSQDSDVIKITIDTNKFNNKDNYGEHWKLIEGMVGEATPTKDEMAKLAGEKGYVGVSFGSSGITPDIENFTVDGKWYGDFEPGDFMFFAIATFDGEKMVLSKDATHTVTFEWKGTLYTWTVDVVSGAA